MTLFHRWFFFIGSLSAVGTVTPVRTNILGTNITLTRPCNILNFFTAERHNFLMFLFLFFPKT